MGDLINLLSQGSGLFLVLFLLCVATSYIQQLISAFLDLRARIFADAIQNLFQPFGKSFNGIQELKRPWSDGKEIWENPELELPQDEIFIKKINENFIKAFYSQPFISSLSRPGHWPSYIPSTVFSHTLLYMYMQASRKQVEFTSEGYLNAVASGIYSLPKTPFIMGISSYLELALISAGTSETKIDLFQKNIEKWFNTVMDRAAGRYKRQTQLLTVIIALIIVVVFNVDTIGITQSLWREDTMRQFFGNAAIAYIGKGEFQKADDAIKKMDNFNFPILWNGHLADSDPLTPVNPQDLPTIPIEIMTKILGLTLSGIIISVGSSLWFFFLSRLATARSSG